MKTVDYEHVLRIVKRCADENKSARDVYNLLYFAFGGLK